ncbi:MAG: glycosyltransferase [Candidatus Latescibacteria bacterium]|nr:glycosyltransferase [Candidatus Latescibacterota bacterium]
MNVLFFWEKAGGLTLDHKCNPYGPLLSLAFKKIDIYLELGDYAFEKEWLRNKRKNFDVLHINWLHHFYRSEDLESGVKRLNDFAENIHYAHSLGYKIVWTVHNRYPHERPFPELDHLAQLMMSQAADEVIAHCKYSADLVREHFYRTEHLHIIPHGNYIDAYPNEISRIDARSQLGVSDLSFVYLFVGNARPYKGIERLIGSFRKIADSNSVLLLMMRTGLNPEYGEKIKTMVAEDAYIKAFTSSFFETHEFQLYMNASDIAVLPFVDVLTSGSAILALSFAKPVILPNIGCMPELIDETMGSLFHPQEKDGLINALKEVRERNIIELSRAAFSRAEELHWDGIAAKMAVLYRN